MAKAKKITQNINKDAGLLDMPAVHVPHNRWGTPSSNYLSCNIGDIVPIFVDEVLPGEKRKITMGMLSHQTTPLAPLFNAQYTEFRSFVVPYRLCADLLAGYKTRKSPWVKVFGEDNASANASIVVPLTDQKLPVVSDNLLSDFQSNLSAFGGVADSLDYDISISNDGAGDNLYSMSDFNWFDLAAYELIYQKAYRNQNRESATNSKLYKWLFDLYNRTSSATISYNGADVFHKANREKDYFTGSQPFTQKSNTPVTAGLVGNARLVPGSTYNPLDIGDNTSHDLLTGGLADGQAFQGPFDDLSIAIDKNSRLSVYADLSTASGIDINQLRLMIKTQELLEKDMMYGNDLLSSLNAHFGTAPISLVLQEPLELKKVTITSQMQPIFQTSSTTGEPTILGQIGANCTTQSGEFEIVPMTEFKEHGLLVICAVHKAQNSYDSLYYKPKRIFKQSRFDFFTPELNDLGYQPVTRKEFDISDYDDKPEEAVSYNEAWAEYRYKYNKVHGMFEPGRTGAYSFWTLALSNYTDVESMYKQSTTELDRAISVSSAVIPQFFDAYGFIEDVNKPMSLHSIPGFDGVI